MQLPKLSPLQSRLLASVIATCLVIIIWISFQPHHFVYAAELPVAPQDVEYSQLGQLIPPDTDSEAILGSEVHGNPEAEREGGYVGDFKYFDRSLIGRAEEGVDTLTNNEAKEMDTTPGTTKYFVLEKSQIQARRRAYQDSSLELRDTVNTSESATEDEDGPHARDLLQSRQGSDQVYITVNTCQQPIPEHIATDDPPQLTLYVSTSANNQKPGPKSKDGVTSITFQHGYGAYNATTTSDVYIGIDAPALTKGWNGSFSFQITASTDAPYDTYDQWDTFLRMVDTDADSSLFVTQDLLSERNDTANITNWMGVTPVPFSMYAFKSTDWGGKGLEWSKCGLQWSLDHALNSTNSTQKITVDTTMTNRSTSLPKGQFHVMGLEKNTSYVGFLAMDGVNGLVPENMTAIRGSRVWNQFNWTTKAESTCQVIFDLPFCKDVAYAVPSSPQFANNTPALKELYDTQAENYYTNFSNSLAQVACDTKGSAQYSLARTCTDCARDYKAWLCSVLMPRCEDFSAEGPGLKDRNIDQPLANGSLPYAYNMTKEFNETTRERFAFQGSRNPLIDSAIQPGPYKELLPCEDLCFDIVRSCPAQLQFKCPARSMRSGSYGKRESGPQGLTCNFPGALVNLNQFQGAAIALPVRLSVSVAISMVVGIVLWI
ncbi:hypothetical protein K491DRAFT_687965 [Lophiostoma macrostomum CBS 122681]|uniref:FZ domain-containing protein n=1 Tax=Lophiostoma macrostomum CBS 122681 TaxID=1314788 RepID=A0A6A6TL89_9PLEO|nr:hypothetical protein K491DRAFT_687965 [Lophiostoma macrostomum CBS 122681]